MGSHTPQYKRFLNGYPLFIRGSIRDDHEHIDCSQFNELLLLANKDRVELPFFKFFFCPSVDEDPKCSVGEIAQGVERFQKIAMLAFGNFIYAYRKLSKIRTQEHLRQAIPEIAEDPGQIQNRLKQRKSKVLHIDLISREDTYLMGYLSASGILAEHSRAARLEELLKSLRRRTWESLKNAIEAGVSDPPERNELFQLINRFKISNQKRATIENFQKHINRDLVFLRRLREKLKQTQGTGEKNTDVYLTWDHMDIYFATSMRKKWEYEDLYDFVKEVMQANVLQGLHLRYFDPTQSFEKNRIDKGLIESLMLKRANCTVYSVQDTDTLGKDSELAATLAQGKPVIAYAPDIDVRRRIKQLKALRPLELKERFEFVYYADEAFNRRFASELGFIKRFLDRIYAFENRMLWRSIYDRKQVLTFVKENRADLTKFCSLIATSEKEIYNRRASTLKISHPLAVQVNLDTGVANGVLVVRDVRTCAELMFRILTNQMEFDVQESKELNCWLLVERLSGSIFRVVTKDRKLTNCFWNFYRKNEVEDNEPEI